MYFNVCLACEIGYTGANCDMKCPLPMYGKDCQSMCNCRANLCDHVIGCKRLSKSTFFFFTNNSDQNFEYMILSNTFSISLLDCTVSEM